MQKSVSLKLLICMLYVLKTSMKIMLKIGCKVMLQNEGEEDGIMTVQKKEKVVGMFVTAMLMCWCSAWLQVPERAEVYRHYSSHENLCCSEMEFQWATLTQHTAVFCTCITQNIFNYLGSAVLYILFPSLAWIIWILQYCKTEWHWRTFFLWPSYKFTFLGGSTYQGLPSLTGW